MINFSNCFENIKYFQKVMIRCNFSLNFLIFPEYHYTMTGSIIRKLQNIVIQHSVSFNVVPLLSHIFHQTSFPLMVAFQELLLSYTQQLPSCILSDTLNVQEYFSFQMEFNFWKEEKSKGARSGDSRGCHTWGMSHLPPNC